MSEEDNGENDKRLYERWTKLFPRPSAKRRDEGRDLTSRKRGFGDTVLSVAHEDPINSTASLSAPSRLINDFAGTGPATRRVQAQGFGDSGMA
jgi:hypothetical protein